MVRRLALLAFSVAVFLLSAEVLALVIYYYQTGHLFYSFRHTYQPIAETKNRGLTSVGLHPYFGPTHKPGYPFDIPEHLRTTYNGVRTPARVDTNNFGFASPRQYPFTKERDSQFVIGLFGGSVGLWFCEVGVYRLMDDLKRHPFFHGKELVPLCFSHEGYKQPQQLLVLAYFLSIGQRFDMVINIDGFNEVALGNVNNDHGIDISMPSFMHVDPLINLVNQSTLTPEKLQSLAAISRYKERLNGLAARINDATFAATHFVFERSYGILFNRYRAELGTLAKLPSVAANNSAIQVTSTVRERGGDALFTDIAKNWMDASLLMRDMLANQSTPYFHVLQPNQYFTTRTFSSDETAVAIIAESPFKAGAEKGYPFLVHEAEAHGQDGLHFFNAVHVFDGQSSPVYMDNCCHYNLLGNQVLADFIAGRILKSLGPWQRASE